MFNETLKMKLVPVAFKNSAPDSIAINATSTVSDLP